MNINRAVKEMKKNQEDLIKSIDESANKKMPGYIASMKSRKDSIDVHELIISFEDMLQNCMDRLTHGHLSSEYNHSQNMAQQQRIRNISDALQHQYNNLLKTADSKGFPFLG